MNTGLSLICLVAVAAAFAGCGEREQPSAVRTDAAALAKLREVDPDANRLLGGGLEEFRRRGRVALVHQGAYASEAKLAEDVERYALRD